MCQSAIQWIVFCEMFRIFTQANRDLTKTLMIKIIEVEKLNRTDALIEELTLVWEDSVRRTHLFLSEDAIVEIKKFIPDALRKVDHLIVSMNGLEEAVGFIGIEDRTIEMLFISPNERGKGIGKLLTIYSIEKFAINLVTVNEQNPQAIGFYEHLGFKVYKKTETDEQGRPYPLLYMEL